eukprot:358028-Chlamydomonas_euryale.AAC.2
MVLNSPIGPEPLRAYKTATGDLPPIGPACKDTVMCLSRRVPWWGAWKLAMYHQPIHEALFVQVSRFKWRRWNVAVAGLVPYIHVIAAVALKT